MTALGFSLNIKNGRLRVLCVRATRGGSGDVILEPVLEYWATAGEEETLQLRNLAERVETLLTTEVAEAAVIRRMDYNGTVSREVVGKRGQGEGVLAAVTRKRVSKSQLEPGGRVAHIVGTSKKELEADVASKIGADLGEAGAAAWAALLLAEGEPL